MPQLDRQCLSCAHMLACRKKVDWDGYDALYLAVALVEQAVVVTADRGFIAAVTRHGTYSHLIRPLEPG